MEAELCESVRVVPARRGDARSVSGLLVREQLPFFGEVEADGAILDPSPLRKLTPAARERRLVGMLEVLASWGDGSAAAEALRHHRWREEMRRGKPPQRVDLNQRVAIQVIDTLSAPAGTPIPRAKRQPGA